jgi:hypothetical protein
VKALLAGGVTCLAAAGLLAFRLTRLLPEDAQRWGIGALCVLGAGFVLMAVGDR